MLAFTLHVQRVTAALLAFLILECARQLALKQAQLCPTAHLLDNLVVRMIIRAWLCRVARNGPADSYEYDTEHCSSTTASPSSCPSASISVSMSKSLSRITRSVSRAQQARQSPEVNTPEKVQSGRVSSQAMSLRTRSKAMSLSLQGNLTAPNFFKRPQ